MFDAFVSAHKIAAHDGKRMAHVSTHAARRRPSSHHEPPSSTDGTRPLSDQKIGKVYAMQRFFALAAFPAEVFQHGIKVMTKSARVPPHKASGAAVLPAPRPIAPKHDHDCNIFRMPLASLATGLQAKLRARCAPGPRRPITAVRAIQQTKTFGGHGRSVRIPYEDRFSRLNQF